MLVTVAELSRTEQLSCEVRLRAGRCWAEQEAAFELRGVPVAGAATLRAGTGSSSSSSDLTLSAASNFLLFFGVCVGACSLVCSFSEAEESASLPQLRAHRSCTAFVLQHTLKTAAFHPSLICRMQAKLMCQHPLCKTTVCGQPRTGG